MKIQSNDNEIVEQSLYQHIHLLIVDAKKRVAQTINQTLVQLYWHIGFHLRWVKKMPENEHLIIQSLAHRLTIEFGAGFSRANLFHMLRFSEIYSDKETVYALSRHLSWTHFRQLIYIDDDLKRQFYTQLCRQEHWSTRVLAKKIDSMLFERTAIAKAPSDLVYDELTKLSQTQEIAPALVFRDPYILDFLNLPQKFSEADLENAILEEICLFLQELGSDFCFITRQKRITIDNEDYALDLLFYHRRLRRLIAIELKLGKFQAADKGQMELYLRWLDKHERREGEGEPLGIILCAEKKQEHVELLELNKSGIHVAQYLLDLPPREVLELKLHEAIQQAKARIYHQEASESKLIKKTLHNKNRRIQPKEKE